MKKAWDDLHAKYAPSTKGELVELKRAFMGLTLESGKDPEEYLTELESKNRKIKNIESARAMADKDVLIHAVANLPPEYDHLVPELTSKIGASVNALTMEKLKITLREIYKLQVRRGEASEEQALIGYGGND